jgi:hypothetical protein
MVFAREQIPSLQDYLATFFTWTLLAGFVIFPSVFTKLQEGVVGDILAVRASKLYEAGTNIKDGFNHVPL